jgi:hypothetical protein
VGRITRSTTRTFSRRPNVCSRASEWASRPFALPSCAAADAAAAAAPAGQPPRTPLQGLSPNRPLARCSHRRMKGSPSAADYLAAAARNGAAAAASLGEMARPLGQGALAGRGERESGCGGGSRKRGPAIMQAYRGGPSGCGCAGVAETLGAVHAAYGTAHGAACDPSIRGADRKPPKLPPFTPPASPASSAAAPQASAPIQQTPAHQAASHKQSGKGSSRLLHCQLQPATPRSR